MIENPMLSYSDSEIDSFQPVILGHCTNKLCCEEIYASDCVRFHEEYFCNEYCLGKHLVNIGQAVEMGG